MFSIKRPSGLDSLSILKILYQMQFMLMSLLLFKDFREKLVILGIQRFLRSVSGTGSGLCRRRLVPVWTGRSRLVPVPVVPGTDRFWCR
jgi:hypothetical protein